MEKWLLLWAERKARASELYPTGLAGWWWWWLQYGETEVQYVLLFLGCPEGGIDRLPMGSHGGPGATPIPPITPPPHLVNINTFGHLQNHLHKYFHGSLLKAFQGVNTLSCKFKWYSAKFLNLKSCVTRTIFLCNQKTRPNTLHLQKINKEGRRDQSRGTS